MTDKETKTKVVKGRSFMDQYQKAKEDGKLLRKTFRIHTWSTETAHLIGRVKSINEFTGGKFEAVVNNYILETDDGLVSCILGSATDAQLAGTDLIGKVVHIEFCDKKDLEDGRKVNLFNVDILDAI